MGEILILNPSGTYSKRSVGSVKIQDQDGRLHQLDDFAERLIVEEKSDSLLMIQRRFSKREWLHDLAIALVSFVLGLAAHATWLKRVLVL